MRQWEDQLDPFTSAAVGIVLTLAEAPILVDLDKIFLARVASLGFQNSGYLRVFGEGQFHGAKYLFR